MNDQIYYIELQGYKNLSETEKQSLVEYRKRYHEK